MPPNIRREFTRSQAAVMRVMLDQVVRDPEARCTLLHSHIAILSAMSTTTVHNTVRKAKALGLVQVTGATRVYHRRQSRTSRLAAEPVTAWERET
jgi:hypothetical protein